MTKEKVVIEIVGTKKKDVFLPDLFDVPSFMDYPLIIIDGKNGLTKFN